MDNRWSMRKNEQGGESGKFATIYQGMEKMEKALGLGQTLDWVRNERGCRNRDAKYPRQDSNLHKLA